MTEIWVLATKDLQLLIRDVRSALILLATPLVLILVLGVALGEGFGEKPDDRLRISVLNLDCGLPEGTTFPEKPWSEVVLDDLNATPDIRLEMLHSRSEAERLIGRSRRSAVLIFQPDFSERLQRCSFLSQGDPPPINPLGRDGVRLEMLGLQMLVDPTQPVSAAVIEQVAQVTLLRVVVPWMIGRAFERVGDDTFMAYVAQRLQQVKPIPPAVLQELDPVVQKLLENLTHDPEFLSLVAAEFARGNPLRAVSDAAVVQRRAPEFRRAVQRAFQNKELLSRVGRDIAFGEVLTPAVRREVGPRVQEGVAELFSNYNFRARTWSELVKSDPRQPYRENRVIFRDTSGSGLLGRGGLRYQLLVPTYTVLFMFFLVLSGGWLFVAERTHHTLTRLRAAPISDNQILLGKLIPCLLLSVFQGVFLFACGYWIFGLQWGSEPLYVLAVLLATSCAAVGLTVLVASLARTETQVSVLGTLVVLALGGLSGALMPRDLMPEQMRTMSLFTPPAWSLEGISYAISQPHPDPLRIAQVCAVLLGFGIVFTLFARWRVHLAC
jgi:ABC-type transport system involved in cytochrome c biogenesis permease component